MPFDCFTSMTRGDTLVVTVRLMAEAGAVVFWHSRDSL
jgi:hypothetical protein